MTGILVAYEDHYCLTLDRAIRRALKEIGPLSIPRECHSVEGVTNFPNFVRARWPLFRDTGYPARGKPKPTVLLCIADADRAAEQLGLPKRQRPYSSWILDAEQQFQACLRERSDQPRGVHGMLLRWSLESTLIAAFDEREAMTRLAGRRPLDDSKLADFVDRCRPNPRTVGDDDFVDAFDDPQGCLSDLAHSQGWHPLKKGDRRKDDALEWLSLNQIDKLMGRVPDIGRIARRIRELALSATETATTRR